MIHLIFVLVLVLIGRDRRSWRLELLLFPWETASERGSEVLDHVLVQTLA